MGEHPRNLSPFQMAIARLSISRKRRRDASLTELVSDNGKQSACRKLFNLCQGTPKPSIAGPYQQGFSEQPQVTAPHPCLPKRLVFLLVAKLKAVAKQLSRYL